MVRLDNGPEGKKFDYISIYPNHGTKENNGFVYTNVPYLYVYYIYNMQYKCLKNVLY